MTGPGGRARAARLALGAALAAILALGTPSAQGDDGSLRGRVVRVKDGDSLVVLVDRRPIEVRLSEVDAPESGQPYGRRARQALSGLVFGRNVRLVPVAHDRYGRTVAHVFVDGVDVVDALLRSGAVWAYPRYAHRPEVFALEAEARAARVGLWRLPESERMPPWEWRHGHDHAGNAAGFPPTVPIPPAPLPLAAGGASAHAAAPDPASFTCGTKRFCREMASCEEARFYQAHCGAADLDGDGDGRPCEALCGP